MGKGIVGRWLSVLAALLLCAAPGWANYLPGAIEGRVYDTDEGDEAVDDVTMVLMVKDGNGYWTTVANTYTDDNGHYSFANVYTGDYKVHAYHCVQYGGGEYGSEKECSVSGGATVIVNFPLSHLLPNVTATAKGPSGTVGNDGYIDVEVTTQPGAYDLQSLWVWVWDARTGRVMWVFLGTSWGYYVISSEYLDPSGERVCHHLRFWWSTTGYYGSGGLSNGPVTIGAAGGFTDCWPDDDHEPDAGTPPANDTEPGSPGGGGIGANVQNLVITDMNTSAGVTGEPNQDYFLLDATPGSDYPQPWVDFTIADAGRTSDDQGNTYRYHWWVLMLDTRYTKGFINNLPTQGAQWSGWVDGEQTGTGPVHVPIPLTGWGEPIYKDGTLTYRPAKGSYTFEIVVQEVQTGDQYWAKWPYRTTVPSSVPGTSTPGDNLDFDMPTDTSYALTFSHYLEDDTNQEPSTLRIHAIRPDLTRIGNVPADKTLNILHGPAQIASFASNDLRDGDYIGILVGEDSHGADVPYSSPLAQPGWYRERANKRLLAVNAREPRPQASLYDWTGSAKSSAVSDLLRQRLYAAPSQWYQGYAAKALGAADWWATAVPRLRRDHILFLACHGDAGQIVPFNYSPGDQPAPPPPNCVFITASDDTQYTDPQGWKADATFKDQYWGALADCKVIVFASCNSALTHGRWGNLLIQSVERGQATAAIGFNQHIPLLQDREAEWVHSLFMSLARGEYTTAGNVDRSARGLAEALRYAGDMASAIQPPDRRYEDFTLYPIARGTTKIVPALSSDVASSAP